MELVLETIFADLGVGSPVPRFTAVDFNLRASDLDAASSDALLMAGFVIPVLALAANAAYRDPQLVTVYDADEALTCTT